MVLESALRRERGFTLVEVLVSMVILAVGLLGLAALQGRALKDSQDAYFYSQASLLAYEMGDRIRANGVYWAGVQKDGSGVPMTDASGNPVLNDMPDISLAKDCTGMDEYCDTTQMAATDLKYWQDSALKVLPAPTGYDAKIVDIQRSSNVGLAPCTGTGASLCLTTIWARVNTRENSALSSDMTYRFEVTPKLP
ncbi:MAG: type IV pilus modification protein PilV [Methylococcaceae bacterium]